ncbi:MAG: hypothetical protein ACOC0B_02995 [bacterium]
MSFPKARVVVTVEGTGIPRGIAFELAQAGVPEVFKVIMQPNGARNE